MKRKTKKNLFRLYVIVSLALIIGGSYYFWQNFNAKPQVVKPLTGSKIQVKLYYYNHLRDTAKSLSPKMLFPVTRNIPKTPSPIQDTIKLLLKGNLTKEEKIEGFSTEFPHPGFELKSTHLKNGILTLRFSEVLGFTSGGAARMELISEQIIKTAKQFPNVKQVEFEPAYLFQP
ncbi:MAG: GerMN domain-containing protein [Candidatus Margulisbacteria bacterium]|nr:GerMN domain-containing protein [Candidatus Margulisiibacteriota bacterium]